MSAGNTRLDVGSPLVAILPIHCSESTNHLWHRDRDNVEKVHLIAFAVKILNGPIQNILRCLQITRKDEK